MSLQLASAPLLRPVATLAVWMFVMQAWTHATRIPTIGNDQVHKDAQHFDNNTRAKVPESGLSMRPPCLLTDGQKVAMHEWETRLYLATILSVSFCSIKNNFIETANASVRQISQISARPSFPPHR